MKKSSWKIYQILFFAFFLMFNNAFSQNIGDEKEFGPIVIQLEADWAGGKNTTKRATEIFNQLPPGYVLMGNRAQLFGKGKNNASYSVSTIAGGSNYSERHEITETYDDLIELAIKYKDFGAEAKLRQQRSYHLTTFDQFSSSHNTLRVKAEAHTAGNFFDRWSGWLDLKVYAKAVYIGDPNPQALMLKIKEDIPIVDKRKALVNSGPIKMRNLKKPNRFLKRFPRLRRQK